MIRQIISVGPWLLCCLLLSCSLDSTPFSTPTRPDPIGTKATHKIPTAVQPAHTAENKAASLPTAVFSPPARPTSSQQTGVTPRPTYTVNDSTCEEKIGRLEHSSLESDLMHKSLQYQVYLPPCYDQNSKQTYPTLYLLHGQGYAESQWVRLGAVETSNKMIAADEVSPFIIVLPHELLSNSSQRSNFDQFIVKELIPAIDNSYRTIPDREFRAVGGLSRGAGWAVELGINHWDLFGAFGAHSPAVFNTNVVSMGNLLDAIPPGKYPRIFIDTGDREPPSIIESAIWFGDLLNQKSIPHEWYRFSGVHNESYWREHLEGYLRWYTGSW